MSNIFTIQSWATKWMKANRPYHEFDGIDTWGNEFSEYLLYPNGFDLRSIEESKGDFKILKIA